MKRRIKIGIISIIIIVAVIVAFSFIAKQVDKNRVEEGKKPIFCIKNSYKIADGGTTEYYGLGYKVIDFSTESGYQAIKIGSWDMQYEDFRYEIDKQDAIAYYKEKLESLPKELSVEEAVRRNFFVCSDTDEVYHKEILERFVKNTQMDAKERKADEITIAIYSERSSNYLSFRIWIYR